MATQFTPAFTSPVPAPFLLGKKLSARPSVSFADAMSKAAAAEAARIGLRRPCQRIAAFLCELGRAYGGRTELPISRSDLANVLNISLVKVKRVLALLSLSGVLSSDGRRVSIIDWRKLGGAAGMSASDLASLCGDDEDELFASIDGDDDKIRFLTSNGDPACFV